MSEQENIRTAHTFFDAWNAGDLSKANPYRAEGYMAEASGAPGPMNLEQHLMYLQNFLTAFPGSQFEVWLTVAQGDYVVEHWKVDARNMGPLHSPSGAAIPPTGKSISVKGTLTSEVKDGKVLRTWGFWDVSSLLGQLGLLPPM